MSISFYVSEHIFFLWKYHLLDKSHEKKLKKLGWLPCYYILFNLRWPINREYLWNDQFFTFRTIEKLFFILRYFRFYEMNFFCWNLMPWEQRYLIRLDHTFGIRPKINVVVLIFDDLHPLSMPQPRFWWLALILDVLGPVLGDLTSSLFTSHS